MTDKEDREGVYRAMDAHSRNFSANNNERDTTLALIEIAVQARRIGNSLEAIAETRTSIAVSLDRIAATLDRLWPPKGERGGCTERFGSG